MSDKGFALLIVLWALVPLSMLFLTLAATGRSDVQVAARLRDAARLAAVADGAINTAIFDVLASDDLAEAPRAVRMPGGDVAVDVTGLSGLVNPNTASADVLRALMVRLGASDARARLVAAAMVDWRTPGQKAGVNGAKAPEYRSAGLDYGPPGGSFESVGELRLVLGMTPALLDALTPYLSLYAGDPDPRLAAPVVRQALIDVGVTRSAGRPGTQVFQVTASVAGPGHTRTTRRAVIGISPASRRGWQVLAWDTVYGE